jgi:hypothetical protein
MRKGILVLILAALAGFSYCPVARSRISSPGLPEPAAAAVKLDGVRGISASSASVCRESGYDGISRPRTDSGFSRIRETAARRIDADILVLNPNDGTAGSTKTTSTLTSLEELEEAPSHQGNDSRCAIIQSNA